MEIEYLTYMKTSIGIEDKNRQNVTAALSKLLADEFVLSVKTKNAHWNLEGADFYEKHLFFESQFTELDKIIDSIAERIRSLGHYVDGSLNSFLELTHLTEQRKGGNKSNSYFKQLLADHESIIIYLRGNIAAFAEDYQDSGSSDFITGLMETHEKMAWFLRAHSA